MYKVFVIMPVYESPLSRTAPAIPLKPFGEVGRKPYNNDKPVPSRALAMYLNTLALDLSIELEQWLQHGIPIPEHPPLEEVGQSLGDLILHVNASRDRKDIVELLQCSLFGLRYPEENHDQSNEVQSAT
jgi:hypothetical protein